MLSLWFFLYIINTQDVDTIKNIFTSAISESVQFIAYFITGDIGPNVFQYAPYIAQTNEEIIKIYHLNFDG